MVQTYYGSFENPSELLNALSVSSIDSGMNATGETTPKSAENSSNAPTESVLIVEDDECMTRDKFSAVYLIFLLHGIGVLLPWNTFLTISAEYFIDYKLMNATGTDYKSNFFSYLGACSQIPNLLCNLINLFIIVHGAGLVRRIFGALFIITIICLFTIALIPVNSESWPFPFFLLTMLSVVLLNAANGIYQNSIFGIASDFPWRFINALILGSNTCGTFISILAILTFIFSSNIQWATFLYFGIALVTIIACIVTFAFLPRLPFYQYYIQRAEKARKARKAKNRTQNVLLNESTGDASQIDVDNIEPDVSLQAYIAVFKQSWRHMLDVFLVFFVTLALFPAVLIKVDLFPNGREYDLFVPKKLFSPVFIFLNFNAFALLGNFIANYIQWPSPKHLSTIVLPRLLFIPIFWLYNYVPEGQHKLLPVLLTNEWSFFLLIALMAVSHGYCSSLAMMYAPKVVPGTKAQLAGMMSAFILVSGITAGVLFTFIESWLFS